MSGSGYDLSVDTYSPEGRVFQVEYAAKAVDLSGTAIGIQCLDGVLLGVEKALPTKLADPSALRRVYPLDKQCGVCVAGYQPDGRHLMTRGREEARAYREVNACPISGTVLREKLGAFMQMYTVFGAYRPLGCATLLGSYGDDGPQLFLIDPSGETYGYHACAVGKGKTAAKAELEKLSFGTLKCREALKALVRILHNVHDEKDKLYAFELGWVCEESKQTFCDVPKELVEEILKELRETEKKDQVIEEGSPKGDMTVD